MRKATFRNVEDLAREQGKTFYQISKELGYNRSLFSDWKSGKSMPKTDKLLKIADFFGVSVEFLINTKERK